MSYEFTLFSLNVRGLRCRKKRSNLYHWLSQHKCNNGITFLQEAHCDLGTEKAWGRQWTGTSYFSHGTNDSCGVITLIGKYLEFELLDKVVSDNGRLIILYCLLEKGYARSDTGGS